MSDNEDITTRRARVSKMANMLGYEFCELLRLGDNDFVNKKVEEIQNGTAAVRRALLRHEAHD